MATYEGTGTGTTGGQYYTLQLVVNEDSYDIASNSSLVSWALKLSSRNNYSFSSWSFPITANVDGEVYNENVSRSMSANSTITIASGTKTISHNTDGTKSISCSATVRATGASYLPGNIDASGTLALTNIPRYANFTEHYIQSTGLNSITVHWNADAGCDWVQYSINDGAWTDTGGLTYTISGLAPNTYYNIRTRIRRADSQLWTESGYIGGSTKDIARVTGAINFNSNQNPYMEFTNPTGQTCNLRLEVGGSIISRNGYTGTGGGYTFELTQAERNLLYGKCANSNTLSVRYVVSTLLNGNETWWSYVDKTMTVVNSNPTFANFAYEDIGPDSTQLTGDNQIVINNYNVVKVTITSTNKATAINSATMSKYRLVSGNKSVEANYSNDDDVTLSLENITDRTLTVYAIDSRGNSTPISKVINIWKDYTDIAIKTATVTRLNGVGTETRLIFEGTLWNDNFGDEQNTIVSCEYKYKKTSDSTYISGTTEIIPAISNNTFTANVLIKGDLGAGGFDVQYNYNIQLVIVDKVGENAVSRQAQFNIILGTGIPAIAIHKRGVSFGGPYDTSEGGKCQIEGKNILSITNLPGFVQEYAGSTAPAGWLMCDGSAVSRTDYADLFAVIGTSYGVGDGSTTFNLPNLKGRIPVGLDSNDSDFDTLGETGGEKKHTLTVNEMPTHKHEGLYWLGSGDFPLSLNGRWCIWISIKLEYWSRHEQNTYSKCWRRTST